MNYHTEDDSKLIEQMLNAIESKNREIEVLQNRSESALEQRDYYMRMARTYQRDLIDQIARTQELRDQRKETEARLIVAQQEHAAEIEMLVDIVSRLWLFWLGVADVPEDISDIIFEWLTEKDTGEDWSKESVDTQPEPPQSGSWSYGDLPF